MVNKDSQKHIVGNNYSKQDSKARVALTPALVLLISRPKSCVINMQ